MTRIDPTTLTPDQLAPMLHAWADGLYSDEAAIGLLTHAAGGIWLRRHDFLTACIDAVDDGWTRDGVAALASVDWDAASTFADRSPASTSELAVLRLACSLAGVDTGPLRSLASGLDTTNTGLLLEALAHRAGWHEHHLTRTVTGHLDPPTAADSPAVADCASTPDGAR